ncbi:hypothetical protein [Streptomyces rimosus]|uniref:hypothetical protein n=1 Tax=Streptomyces rimosus TaxID=1927 RepID=UPI0004C77A65|nr:hypothetical protein [Streptomyces rimosus]
MKHTVKRFAALGVGVAVAFGAAGFSQAQAQPRAQGLDVWVNPGHSASGKSYLYAGRAAFRADGDTFAVYDDAKDGYGVQLVVHATKKNGSGLDGAYFYGGGGKTHNGSFLKKDLQEGSKVKFRLCMSKNGSSAFACGKWRTTKA